ETAAGLVDRLEDADVWILMAVRCSQARILSLRGQGGLAADWLDWLESTSRGTGVDEQAVNGLGACALARAGLGQDDRAAALLTELAATPAFRNTSTYGATAHALVRAALAIGDRELAERLGAGVEQPRRPIDEHALAATNAALMEARGDLSSAAEAYAEAAGRWERFGVVPEQAFALLGQARCLIGLSLPTEASAVLQRARVIFDRLEAASAIAEIDALIQRATTLSL
ncbi:MAG: hypothetical protein QOI81_1532, partial [Actinomycetota bacterium]|nr:hypothetical protein [Actinomycetota bacterium]